MGYIGKFHCLLSHTSKLYGEVDQSRFGGTICCWSSVYWCHTPFSSPRTVDLLQLVCMKGKSMWARNISASIWTKRSQHMDPGLGLWSAVVRLGRLHVFGFKQNTSAFHSKWIRFWRNCYSVFFLIHEIWNTISVVECGDLKRLRFLH